MIHGQIKTTIVAVSRKRILLSILDGVREFALKMPKSYSDADSLAPRK